MIALSGFEPLFKPPGAFSRGFCAGVEAVNSDPLETVCAANASLPAITASAEAGAENWIKLSPYGEHTFHDYSAKGGPKVAGVQVVDREAANQMVAHFNRLPSRVGRLFRGLPVYVGHPDFPDLADEYPDKEVYGHISALEGRDDGLYGRASWTEQGRAMVNEQQFRYPTPYWKMAPVPGREKAYRPTRFKSLGLTNTPNIREGNAPFGAQNSAPLPTDTTTDQKDELTAMQKSQLTKSLGLPETATDEEVQTKLSQLSAAASASTSAASDLAAANARAAGLEKARNDGLLTSAINEGRITAAQRPSWEQALQTDFEAKSKELTALKPALNTSPRVAVLGSRRDETDFGSDEITAINEAVTTHMKDTGEKDRHKAWIAVKTKKPELFAAKQPV